MPWSTKSVQVGQTYGVGSLKYCVRTVVATLNKGRVIQWVAGPAPLLGSRATDRWVEGELYETDKHAFFAWVRNVQLELRAKPEKRRVDHNPVNTNS
jgi:hypothetical protein